MEEREWGWRLGWRRLGQREGRWWWFWSQSASQSCRVEARRSQGGKTTAGEDAEAEAAARTEAEAATKSCSPTCDRQDAAG